MVTLEQFKIPRPALIDPLWKIIETNKEGFACMNTLTGMAVISSVHLEKDNLVWQHVSCSFKHRLPEYHELCAVKDAFIGKDKLALQLFVPEKEHVNIMKNCLHLWCCLSGPRPCPDFRKFGGI